jgi:elongation factor G
VEAHLPVSSLTGLDAELRSLSQGLASYRAEFDHLSELSGKLADDVIKGAAAAH